MFNSSHTRIRIRNEIIAAAPGVAEWYEHFQLLRQSREWRKKGWPTPIPHLAKRSILLGEAARIGASTFIETGTYLGDTPWFLRESFTKIFSIEVEPRLAELARIRFRDLPNVKIIEADSPLGLKQIAPQVVGRSLVWLDGHYSAGITGRGANDCPVWEELRVIKDSWSLSPSIFVDDARCFGEKGEYACYPAIAEVKEYAKRNFPDHAFSVENDMIMLRAPATASST